MPMSDPDPTCPICGEQLPVTALDGHLRQEHHRDGGGVNPAPENKAWPPAGMETKVAPMR